MEFDKYCLHHFGRLILRYDMLTYLLKRYENEEGTQTMSCVPKGYSYSTSDEHNDNRMAIGWSLWNSVQKAEITRSKQDVHVAVKSLRLLALTVSKQCFWIDMKIWFNYIDCYVWFGFREWEVRVIFTCTCSKAYSCCDEKRFNVRF